MGERQRERRTDGERERERARARERCGESQALSLTHTRMMIMANFYLFLQKQHPTQHTRRRSSIQGKNMGFHVQNRRLPASVIPLARLANCWLSWLLQLEFAVPFSSSTVAPTCSCCLCVGHCVPRDVATFGPFVGELSLPCRRGAILAKCAGCSPYNLVLSHTHDTTWPNNARE